MMKLNKWQQILIIIPHVNSVVFSCGNCGQLGGKCWYSDEEWIIGKHYGPKLAICNGDIETTCSSNHFKFKQERESKLKKNHAELLDSILFLHN